ncbi:hypothetical protein [Streptomyces syringium]|uniref:hypothetical protein n=1 Tax=Streptomyces syringium TaxID=76729 RepID=UPI00340B6BE5
MTAARRPAAGRHDPYGEAPLMPSAPPPVIPAASPSSGGPVRRRRTGRHAGLPRRRKPRIPRPRRAARRLKGAVLLLLVAMPGGWVLSRLSPLLL